MPGPLLLVAGQSRPGTARAHGGPRGRTSRDSAALHRPVVPSRAAAPWRILSRGQRPGVIAMTTWSRNSPWRGR